MKVFITSTLVFILALSCKKEEKTYYPDGSIETVVSIVNSKYHGLYQAFYEDGELEIEGNYEQGLMQGLFTYYYRPDDNLSKSEMLFRNDTVYYRRDYNKSRKLVKEGPLKENSKAGKWMYYDIEDGYTKKIREVFYINEKSHLNQNWELNRQGDTIGGNHYAFMAENPLDFNNQLVHFRIDRLPHFKNSELYVCIPKRDSEPFDTHFSNEKEVILDTINLVIQQEPNVVNLNYDTPGKKMLRGYLLEKKSFTNVDTLDYDLVTRKVYFEKEIYIKDRTEDNSTLP